MSEQPSDAPEPQTEEPEKYPGGADAIDDSGKYGDTPGGPTTRDLDPDDNPAVDDLLPDEIAAPDDKPQAPEETSGEGEVADEPPA
ncbi:hypothetical protein [Nocardioides speluncae]|uniref:hypothetical protein n=1 Tax=Nocardioides speluncae TaxID=2670337 RepID=UPI000D69FFDE|nr:hypothetical protein [Nocardioides speluncae]